jgi:hypothetical protein
MSDTQNTYVGNFHTLKGLLTNQYDYNAFTQGIYHGMDENGDIILQDPNQLPGHQGHSKSLTVLNSPQFQFTQRVSWDITDPNAAPQFVKPSGKLESPDTKWNHKGKPWIDGFFRGGLKTNLNRRRIDFERVRGFLASDQGQQFQFRQISLQLLNPQINTRVWNKGASLLASILGAGEIKFKRSGLIPEPVGSDVSIGNSLSNLLGGGNAADTILGGNYIGGIIEKSELREERYNMGDPGGSTIASGFKEFANDLIPKEVDTLLGPYMDEGYNQPLHTRFGKADKINLMEIIQAKDGVLPDFAAKYAKDFVNFRMEVVDSDNSSNTNYIIFRAFLDNLNDSFSSTHNTVKYNGRSEKFFTYAGFDRTINLKFKIAAQTRWEMKPLYQKLNYLAAQTAGNYSSAGRLRTPFMRLTVGDYFKRLAGVLTSVNITWSKEYPWEIALDKEVVTNTNETTGDSIAIPQGEDKDMLVLPHALDVDIAFKPIHDFTPQNHHLSPFLGINDWLKEDKDVLPQSDKESSLYPSKDTKTKGDGKTKKNNNEKKNEEIRNNEKKKKNPKKNKTPKPQNQNTGGSRSWGYNIYGNVTNDPSKIDKRMTELILNRGQIGGM